MVVKTPTSATKRGNTGGALMFALPVRLMLSALLPVGAWRVTAPPRVEFVEWILAFFLRSSIMPDLCSRQAAGLAVAHRICK